MSEVLLSGTPELIQNELTARAAVNVQPGRSFDPDRLPSFVSGVTGSLRALVAGCDVDPRPYQIRIIESALRMFAGTFKQRDGHHSPAASSVLIESPTGSGKTVMGLATRPSEGYSVLPPVVSAICTLGPAWWALV